MSEMVWGGPGWGFVTQGIHISGRAREKCAAKPQTDETFCDPGSQTEAFCDPGLELIPGQAHLRIETETFCDPGSQTEAFCDPGNLHFWPRKWCQELRLGPPLPRAPGSGILDGAN